ncbi:MAG: transposase [Thermodesulfobacteriota bacterium]|nr:transposase [Thermodesulfobacteriota bacterium]
MNMGAYYIMSMGNTVGACCYVPIHRNRTAQPNTPQYEEFHKPTCDSIPTIVRSFKSTVARQINTIRNMPGAPVWQRNYYEHIICCKRELNGIREYILYNPLTWERDVENPVCHKKG